MNMTSQQYILGVSPTHDASEIYNLFIFMKGPRKKPSLSTVSGPGIPPKYTLQETNISPKNGILKMIFLFPRWDMLIPWRVFNPPQKSTTTRQQPGSKNGSAGVPVLLAIDHQAAQRPRAARRLETQRPSCVQNVGWLFKTIRDYPPGNQHIPPWEKGNHLQK